MRRHPLAALGLLFVAVLVAGTLLGPTSVDPAALLRGETTASTIVWTLRMPRVLLGLACGSMLAVTGLAFQTAFRNDLAEPYTLGTASGAALGAALVFTFGSSSTSLPLVGVASFGGAIAATALVTVLGERRGRGRQGGTLLLAGVAVALTCQAMILALQYVGDAADTLRMVRWMMGGLGVVGYGEVLWVVPWLAAFTLVALRRRHELDLLLTGDEIAASRGLDPRSFRRWLLLFAACAVGAVVAVAGPIGFVGLMVPHMVRRWLGPEHGRLVPACWLGGAALLAGADLAARLVVAPAELPVGIVTALLGGPFFLWLLGRSATDSASS